MRDLLRRSVRAIRAMRFLPAYCALSVMKHVVPIEELGRRQWRGGTVQRDHDREARIVADIQRVSRRLGMSQRDCTERSLLFYRELSRAGAKPTLVVGLRHSPDGVMGHAWVIADGSVVAEPVEHAASFNPIVSFGDRGIPDRLS